MYFSEEEALEKEDKWKSKTTSKKLWQKSWTRSRTGEEFSYKLVEREKAHREKLSGAIKQKITGGKGPKGFRRTQDIPGKGEGPDEDGKPEIDKLIDQKLAERLEERELEALRLPDELKEEVKELAKLKGISVREAAKLPYILSRKEEVEEEERIKRQLLTNKQGSIRWARARKPLNPADFDFDSEEGIKLGRSRSREILSEKRGNSFIRISHSP